jgi:hypothetical protein
LQERSKISAKLDDSIYCAKVRSYLLLFNAVLFMPPVADPGLVFPDPGSDFFPSRIRIRIKEFKFFNPKNGFQALGNMIRVVHFGSLIRILTFYPSRIPDPGVKAPDPGSGSATLHAAVINVY